MQLSSFHGALSSGGSFYYHSALVASRASPALGPERGGTRAAGFREAYTLRCALGTAAPPYAGGYGDESQLECSTPVHAAGSALVLRSMNGRRCMLHERRVLHVPGDGVDRVSYLVGRPRRRCLVCVL